TVIVMSAVPDLSGDPPSNAVKTISCFFCCSRSRGVSSTSSANLLPSLRV
ncbi:hypothetical protein NQD34_007605, partial [Periophthalmus magnuspinnatus]